MNEEALLEIAFPGTYFVFQMRDKLFGFEARCLWEISTTVALSPLPLSSVRLTGMTHLHGKIIPVVDLCSLLELPFLEPRLARGFVAVKPPGWNAPAGFYAGNILGFEKFTDAEIEASPEGALPFLRRRTGSPERPVELLDMGRLFAGVQQNLLAGVLRDTTFNFKGANHV